MQNNILRSEPACEAAVINSYTDLVGQLKLERKSLLWDNLIQCRVLDSEERNLICELHKENDIQRALIDLIISKGESVFCRFICSIVLCNCYANLLEVLRHNLHVEWVQRDFIIHPNESVALSVIKEHIFMLEEDLFNTNCPNNIKIKIRQRWKKDDIAQDVVMQVVKEAISDKITIKSDMDLDVYPCKYIVHLKELCV